MPWNSSQGLSVSLYLSVLLEVEFILSLILAATQTYSAVKWSHFNMLTDNTCDTLGKVLTKYALNKWIVHQKKKIVLSFTHPSTVTKPRHRRKTNASQWISLLFGYLNFFKFLLCSAEKK